ADKIQSPRLRGSAMQRREFISLLGSAVTWPLAARAQSRNHIPKIAVLWHAADAEGEAPYFGSLIEGFASLGYGEDKIALEHRFPNEKPELFSAMAAELVSL